MSTEVVSQERLLERAVEDRTVMWWKGNFGHPVIKLNILGRRGWPDRVFLMPKGRSAYIEFKRVDEKARPLQEFVHKQLRDLGHAVAVCQTFDEAKTFLEGELAKGQVESTPVSG